MIKNKLFISFLSFVPMVASADYLNDKWTNLVKEKQELISELEKCQKNTKGFKIAGLATLGVSAIGIGVNIGEAVKINSLEGDIQLAQQRISNLDTEIDKAKNTCGTKNCPGTASIPNAAEHICIKDEWKVLKCAATYSEQGEGKCKRDGKDITYYNECVAASAVPQKVVSTEEDWLAFLAGGEIVEDGCEGVEKPKNRFHKIERNTTVEKEEPVCIDNDWWFKGECASDYKPLAEKTINSDELYVRDCTKDETIVREERTSHALKLGVAVKGIKGQIVYDVLGGYQVPDPLIGACASLEIPFEQIYSEYGSFSRRVIAGGQVKFAQTVIDYLYNIGVSSPHPECLVVGGNSNYGLNGCGENHYLNINEHPEKLQSTIYPHDEKLCTKNCTGVQFQYRVKLINGTTNCKNSLNTGANNTSDNSGANNTSGPDSIINKACIRNKDLALDECLKQCKELSMPVTNVPELNQSECFIQRVAVSEDGMNCYCNPRESEGKRFLWNRGDQLDGTANGDKTGTKKSKRVRNK